VGLVFQWSCPTIQHLSNRAQVQEIPDTCWWAFLLSLLGHILVRALGLVRKSNKCDYVPISTMWECTMHHKVNKWELRTCHILRQKMLPFKFGLGTQLRVHPELDAGITPEPGMGKVCNWVPMLQRVHAVKHCNPFFSSSPDLRKPSWTSSRETSNRWKLPTRMSFF
jgi:hypothetical protein